MNKIKEFSVQCVYTAKEDIRCKRCRRLLMKGEVKAVEIKCPKCGYIQNIGGGDVTNGK